MQLVSRHATKLAPCGTGRTVGRPTLGNVPRPGTSWVLRAQQQETTVQESIEEGVNVTGKDQGLFTA